MKVKFLDNLSKEWIAKLFIPSILDLRLMRVYLTSYPGRYWPIVGPQQTLYVPAPKIKPACQNNTIVLFELENPGCR